MPTTSPHSRVPRPPLGAYVDLIWFATAGAQPHAHERILPTGSIDLVCTLDHHGRARSHVCGARSEYLQLATSAPFQAIGVRFKPGGAFPFFRVPMGELHNLAVPLESIWGASTRTLIERLWSAPSPAAMFDLLEAALLAEAHGRLDRHPAVEYAVTGLRASSPPQTIARLAGDMDLSSRRFIEVFRREVGLSPKLFARIQRFNEVLRTLDATPALNWTEIALGCGYFDQPHFIHDFRAFSGVSPTGYLRHRTSRLHVAIAA